MTAAQRFSHEFVDHVPDHPADGVLYVSMKFATVIHFCACGCGTEVVTPLDPTDFKLIFDGETISLRPSVGNWQFPCRSHYWITGSRVLWAGEMPADLIQAGRRRSRVAKGIESVSARAPIGDVGCKKSTTPPGSRQIIRRVLGLLRRRSERK